MLLLNEVSPMPNNAVYFIGVGCNIKPEVNVPDILSRLLNDFSRISVSRLCFTEPVGMKSDQLFVNFVVSIESELSPDAMKAYCNQVEQDFGRDRSDPNRKHLDRRADLDIVYRCAPEQLQQESVRVDELCDEHFLRPMFRELLNFSLGQAIPAPRYDCLNCEVQGLSLGQVPATVDLDPRTGHVVIVQ